MELGEEYKKSKEGRMANGIVFRIVWKNFCGFIVFLKLEYKDISNLVFFL